MPLQTPGGVVPTPQQTPSGTGGKRCDDCVRVRVLVRVCDVQSVVLAPYVCVRGHGVCLGAWMASRSVLKGILSSSKDALTRLSKTAVAPVVVVAKKLEGAPSDKDIGV